MKARGELANTYFVLTSDHGFHMGQFRLGACKRQPYETDLRVPFFVRGCTTRPPHALHTP